MKKVSKTNMVFLEKLMAEFNDYSELVALNYQQKAEQGTLQWNRGHLYCVEENLKAFAELLKVNLIWVYGTHPFLERELEYRTVHLEDDDTLYHRTGKCDMKVR